MLQRIHFSPLTLISVLLLSLLTATGCSEVDEEQNAIYQYARSALPEDPELASTYQRSCRSCHSRPGLRAPLTGDGPAWAALIEERGMEGLVENTKEGYGAMPPMGRCLDCNDEEFRALIEFMAEPHDR